MKRSEQVQIKLEFDKIVKYFDKRGDKLTVGECKQELGALRMFIFNLGIDKKENSGVFKSHLGNGCFWG